MADRLKPKEKKRRKIIVNKTEDQVPEVLLSKLQALRQIREDLSLLEEKHSRDALKREFDIHLGEDEEW